MMPMPAYRPTVASRKMKPIQFFGSPICSRIARTMMKTMKPPVYQPYTLFSSDLNALLAAAPLASACPKPAPAMSVLLVDVVLAIELAHVHLVGPDDQHIDDQRALARHPHAERPPEEGEVQIARKVDHHEGDEE